MNRPDPLRAWSQLRDAGESRWLGLMSGTSCDGIDVARVLLEEREEGPEAGRPRVREVSGFTLPFPEEVARDLRRDLAEPAGAEAVARWDARLGASFAAAARAGIEELGDVDAVTVSGHTFVHLPAEGTTLQVGNPALVAEGTRRPVVAGLRASDVARGGEGAPLVPAADRILFGDPQRSVAILNLGGIANLTWLPPGSGEPRALDTGPSNLVLDQLTRIGTGGRLSFDRDGGLAGQGRSHPELVARWLDHSFFEGAVRSTGREEFGEAWVESRQEELGTLTLEDRLATATCWIAETVVRGLERLRAGRGPDVLLVGGGGAHNQAVMAALAARLPVSPEPLEAHRHGVDADLREAAAFAILGHEYLHGRPGSFPGTTGCRFPGPVGFLLLPHGA